MGTYLKDKKIEIWRKTSVTDEDGFPVETEEKIHDGQLWAHYRHVSSKEYWAAKTAQYQEDAVFIINHRTGINPLTDYILYNGQIYDINSIDNYEGGRNDIKIGARYRE